MVIWLGDNEQHDFRLLSADKNMEASKLIADGMKQHFGDAPVFPCIGNHESFPID
jgi:hypothetical protein